MRSDIFQVCSVDSPNVTKDEMSVDRSTVTKWRLGACLMKQDLVKQREKESWFTTSSAMATNAPDQNLQRAAFVLRLLDRWCEC